ncbi:non-canonical purine NTP pyrophosphatase [Helicobacter sp. 23-1044]
MIIIFFSGNLHKAREIKAIFADAEVRIYTEFMDAFEVVENGSSFAENAVLKVSALHKKMINLAHLDSAILREFGEKKVVLMAEDSGICVDALHGMPNIFSARFANLPKNFMDFHAFAEGNSKLSPSILDGDFKLFPSLVDGKSVCSPSLTKGNSKISPSLAEGVRGWVDSSDSENIARLINELKARNLSESRAKFVSCVACCEIFKNQSCEAPKTRPLRGAKNRFQTSSSASADFLLEAEKRGTPPKSEKAAAFWEHNLNEVGGSGRGVQPFLREKTSETDLKNGENVADSALDSANQTKIAESNIDCHDFATQNLAMTKKLADSANHIKIAESSNDSKETIALTTHGFLNGKVITEIRGQNGFGYDPIFVPNGFDKTLAELPSEVKNALSHRRNALDLMRLLLK